MERRTILAGIIVFFIGMLSWFGVLGYQNFTRPKNTNTASLVNSTSSGSPKSPLVQRFTQPVVRSGWNTYRVEKYGFQFQYPNEWKFVNIDNSQSNPLREMGSGFGENEVVFYPPSKHLGEDESGGGDVLFTYQGDIRVRVLSNPEKIDLPRYFSSNLNISSRIFEMSIANTKALIMGIACEDEPTCQDYIVGVALGTHIIEFRTIADNQMGNYDQFRGLVQSLIFDSPVTASATPYQNPSSRYRGVPEGYVNRTFVQDRRAFVLTFGVGLQIVDVSNPASPSMLGTDSSELGPWFAVPYQHYVFEKESHEENRTGVSTIRILDIANPVEPVAVGTFPHQKKDAGFDLFIYHDLAYVRTDETGLSVFDLQDPGHPKKVGTLQGSGDYLIPIGIAGEKLLTQTKDTKNNRISNIDVFSLSNPREPDLIQTIPTESYGVRGDMKVFGGSFVRTVIGSKSIEIFTGDFRSPAKTFTLPDSIRLSTLVDYRDGVLSVVGVPKEVSTNPLALGGTSPEKIALENTSYAIYSYRISDTEQQLVKTTPLYSQPTDAQVDGANVYLSYGNLGWEIVTLQ